jgi:hypothetical protein
VTLLDPVFIPITALLVIPITAIGYPLAKALARRMDHQTAQPRVPSEISARLERLEQGMDAIAIEVERISEGQRFVTKLLSDKQAPSNRLPKSSDSPA